MRFLLLAIALLVISLTPPIVPQSTDDEPDDEPEAKVAIDPPTAVSPEDEATIRSRIEKENDNWSYYDMHFGLKEINWNIERRQKDLKKLNEILAKNEAKAVELKQNLTKATDSLKELNKKYDENPQLLAFKESMAATKAAIEEYNIALNAYDNVNNPLLWNQSDLDMQQRAKTAAENEMVAIGKWDETLAKLEKYQRTTTKESIQKEIRDLARATTKEEKGRRMKLMDELAEYDTIPTQIEELKAKINKKAGALKAQDDKIKAATKEIEKLNKIIERLELELAPLAIDKQEKENLKIEKEAITNGGLTEEVVALENRINETRTDIKRLEDVQKEVVEFLPRIKEGIVKDNYYYYYLTEKLKDLAKRREEKKAQLKQMQFNWPRECIKLVLVWFVLFIVPTAFVAYGIWIGNTGERIGIIPFGPRPYWLHWLLGYREYWCDVKEREIGDRNTHQQPYREGPEMWWPLKPWDIYKWIVVKVRGCDEEEEEWDDDIFLRSDPFQRDILLRGEEYREDAQWDGNYASMQRHYGNFNEDYIHFNRKDNAKYKIVNPDKMAGMYGPLLNKRNKHRHPDHKYPLYVPPPPPPMRPAKRIPRRTAVVKPSETTGLITRLLEMAKKETESTEMVPEAGPDDIVNYDGEIVPKRKYWEYYVKLHHRMKKESRLFCYKPWTRKWINDHFADYHEKPMNSKMTGASRKRRGRKRAKKRPMKGARSTAGRDSHTSTTKKKFNKKHHRKHHSKNVRAVQNSDEKQALAAKLKAAHKKHCKRYRKRVRIANLTAEQQKRLAKRGPRVLHRRIPIGHKKIRRALVRGGMKNPLKRILTEVALLEKKRDLRKEKRAEKVKANPALVDAKHLKIRARKLRKHQARLRAENLRADRAEHERSSERHKKRHPRQADLHIAHTYKHLDKLERDDTTDDPAEISEDEEERLNEEERAEYDPFPILQYPDPDKRRTKHHKHCRFYEKKKACQKGEKYAKLHAAKHNMVHDHGHLISQRKVQECPPHCTHNGDQGGKDAKDANRLHHEQKKAVKTAQGVKNLMRQHTKEHIRRHHELHHKKPHLPHVDTLTRIKWSRIKNDRVLWRKWNKDKIAEMEAEDKDDEDEEDEIKRAEAMKEDKKEDKKEKKKKKKDRKGPDGQPVISSIPDPDGWKMDKEEDEERREEEPTQVGTGKIPVVPAEKLERLAPMPDTPEEATQALTLTRTQAERTLEDKTQAMGGELEPPPTTNKHQWPVPPSAPIAPPVGPEVDVTQDDKTAAPGTAVKKSLPREDKPSKAGPPSTFRI